MCRGVTPSNCGCAGAARPRNHSREWSRAGLGVTDWVAHHVHLFEGQQFNPEYLKLNPKAQVPTLVHDGEVIRESSVITDYLDDLYPEPPLKPSNLAKIAQMREWIKESDESGFEGVASLSFVTVFRAKLMGMSESDRAA